MTLTLAGNLTAATLALSEGGIDTSKGLLNIPAEAGYRAFDVFYFLLTSASTPAEREFLGLKHASNYALLARSGTYDPPSYLPTADDAASADDFRASLKEIGIKGAAHRNLISILAGLLKLGDTLSFNLDEEALEDVCEDVGGLLGGRGTVRLVPTPGKPTPACRPRCPGRELSGPRLRERVHPSVRVVKRRETVQQFQDDVDLLDHVAGVLADGKVVGSFQGRMEFGPRAFRHRSILGDPRSPAMQSTMNLKIKFRESFRPFAPVVLKKRQPGDWFDIDPTHESPYMLLVADVLEHRTLPWMLWKRRS